MSPPRTEGEGRSTEHFQRPGGASPTASRDRGDSSEVGRALHTSWWLTRARPPHPVSCTKPVDHNVFLCGEPRCAFKVMHSDAQYPCAHPPHPAPALYSPLATTGASPRWVGGAGPETHAGVPCLVRLRHPAARQGSCREWAPPSPAAGTKQFPDPPSGFLPHLCFCSAAQGATDMCHGHGTWDASHLSAAEMSL